jgi:ribonuclease HI
MQNQKTHFEQIPVAAVKKIVEGLPQEEKESENGWRDLAQQVQVETDSNKMVKLVEQLIQKFDEEKLAKSRAAYRAKDRESSQL